LSAAGGGARRVACGASVWKKLTLSVVE